jgi:hypothetical protein
MCSHKILSPFSYGIAKNIIKQIDNISITFLSIGLSGFTKNLYMNIGIYSYSVDGVG